MKIKYSALVSEMRGKLNGSVASRNRSSAYLRNKVTPVNPRTSRQLAARDILTSQAQAWRGLTEAQRLAWNRAVSAWAKTNIFGDLRNPSGFNLFCRLNANLVNVGEATISVPPTSSSVDTVLIGALTAAFGSPALSLALGAAVPAGHSMVVTATPALSAGKSFVRSELRQISVVAAGSTSPVNLLSAWTAKFGSIPAAGLKIFVEIYFINEATGASSSRQQSSAVIGA